MECVFAPVGWRPRAFEINRTLMTNRKTTMTGNANPMSITSRENVSGRIVGPCVGAGRVVGIRCRQGAGGDEQVPDLTTLKLDALAVLKKALRGKAISTCR
jgi:hypothetical protein